MKLGLTFDDVLLVPQHGVLMKRKSADISTELVRGYPIANPIISANMPSVTGPELAKAMWFAGGFSFLPRFNSIDEACQEYDSVANDLTDCGVSIGIDDMDRATSLAYKGARIFCLDIAHGDHQQAFYAIDTFKAEIKRQFLGIKLVVGNIATAKAAEALCLKGVDAVKVGVGPGAACRTREVTGFGVPQLSAIMEVSELVRNKYPEVRIIADGGIKNSGDIVKALAAGADSVMVGSLLAGCDEAPNPGEYYGNASHTVNSHRAPEGSYGAVERRGSVADTIKELTWGIRSGISYGGGTDIAGLRERAEFIQVTAAGQYENQVRLEEPPMYVLETDTGKIGRL